MELSAPCQPLPGRPFFVKQDGGKTYISTHDHFYLEIERGYKHSFLLWHPDRNKHVAAAGRTRKLLKLRERWRRDEAKWYARFGLEPPGKGRTRCNSKSTGKALLPG